MLKKSVYLLLVFFMISCGASKKTTETNTNENTNSLKEIAVSPIVNDEEKEEEVETEPVVEVEEPVIEKESSSEVPKPIDKNLIYTDTSNATPSLIDKVIWSVVGYKGTPYKYGGSSKEGMDCSGLIYKAFKDRGITIPRRAIWMYQKGYSVPLSSAKKGDLLFFNIPDKNSSDVVNHVGIVSSNENGEVKFLHSINSRGVVLSSLNEAYWKKAFVEAKRVVE